MSKGSADSTEPEQLEMVVQRRLGGRASIRDPRVMVQGDGLILKGIAPSYYAKQLAQHVAIEVSGLPILANEIEVQ